jgi:hypothetical protein
MILENPGIVEEGFFPLDTHLRAGNGGLIDLLAADGSGTLAVLEIGRDGEENLLRRSLEHQGWIVGQVHFLRRLYGPERIHPFRAPRAILVSSRFSRGFLDKIAELPVSITALTYRLAGLDERAALRLQPATPAAGEPADEGLSFHPEILPPETADFTPRPRELDAGMAMATEIADETARLTPEELEAFYRFERKRLGLKEEGAVER